VNLEVVLFVVSIKIHCIYIEQIFKHGAMDTT